MRALRSYLKLGEPITERGSDIEGKLTDGGRKGYRPTIRMVGIMNRITAWFTAEPGIRHG